MIITSPMSPGPITPKFIDYPFSLVMPGSLIRKLVSECPNSLSRDPGFKSRKRRANAVLATRKFQQLIGMQLCPIPQQQWLAAQNGLCIVCNASDVRHSSVLDLAEHFDSSLCIGRFER